MDRSKSTGLRFIFATLVTLVLFIIIGAATTHALTRDEISLYLDEDVIKVGSVRGAYEATLELLQDRDYETWIYSENENVDVGEIVELVCSQHPEYNASGHSWTFIDDCEFARPLIPPEIEADNIKYLRKADKKADAIVKKIIKKKMTTDEKIKAIHDYLATHCEYDQRVSSYAMSAVHTAYGCLVNKKAVCQGYAAAFNLLLSKCDIPSIAVCGYGNGGTHAWNMAKVGSKVYYYDVTWDDPILSSGPNPKFVRWNYYRISASTMAKDHSWDKHMYASKYLRYV